MTHLKCLIIAEAGVNHNGNEKMAFELVDEAVKSGADAIKFQTFVAENLVTKEAAKAKYQKQTTDAVESQYSMLKHLELSHSLHFELYEYCCHKNIKFLSSAFDIESLNFLVTKLELDRLKIPSGEITNGPLLLAHAQTQKKIILSTGMATLEEIDEALDVLAFGFTSKGKPSRAGFKSARASEYGLNALKEKVTLLHCTTEYPAPYHDINMRAMITMKEQFGLPVGYSDHSEGITVPIVAATLGASVIEKHFTLDKTLSGPDHKSSLEPNELKDMVVGIRMVEQVLGDGVKCPRPSELSNRDIARKSIVAISDIAKGEVFTDKNIDIKRPGTGKSPMEYWELIGVKSHSEFKMDDIVN